MSGSTTPLPDEQDVVAELAARGFEWECDVWGWGYHHLDDAALVQVKRLRSIAFLDLFEVCDVGGVTDQGLANLVGNTSLICLRLGPGITNAGLAHVAGLVQLTELRLDSAAGITDEGMTCLNRLVNLEALSVQFTKVGDRGMMAVSQLPSLKRLEANHTQITENSLGHFARLTSLVSLAISAKVASKKALLAFKAALPNCRVHEI